MNYLVVLTDGEVLHLVVCRNVKEVTNLLLGLKKEFNLVSIESMGQNFYIDYKEFIDKDTNIEFGKGGQND